MIGQFILKTDGQKYDNTDKVTSVNGIDGDVELDADDIETFVGSGVTVLDALNNKADVTELGDYLPLAGGTLTGQLTVNGNSIVVFGGNDGSFANMTNRYFLIKGSTGNWDRAFTFTDNSGSVSYGGFGGLGSATTLNSWYIGKAFNDNTFSIDYASGQLTLTEQLNANGGVVAPSVTNNGIKSTRYNIQKNKWAEF